MTLAVEGADVESKSANLSILVLDIVLAIALTQLESSLFTVW